MRKNMDNDVDTTISALGFKRLKVVLGRSLDFVRPLTNMHSGGLAIEVIIQKK